MRLFGLFLIAVGVVIEALAVGILISLLMKPGVLEVGFIVGIVVAMIVGSSFFIAGIFAMRKRAPISSTTTAVAVGTRVGNYVCSTPQQMELDGEPYTVLFVSAIQGKNGRPSKLLISSKIALNGEFEIVPESGFDRFAKSWGLAKEIQTLDETFDERCFVRSDTVAFTQAFLEEPAARAIIGDLHKQGFKNVVMKDGELRAEWLNFDPAVHDRAELVEEIGARLILLTRKTPQELPEADMTARVQRRTWAAFLWVSLILFALTMFGLIAYPVLNSWPLIGRAAILFLGAFPASLFLVGKLLGGTSRSHYAWATWAMVAIVLFPLGCVGTLATFNGLMDSNPETEHPALIVRKYTTRNKNTTNYHVECRSWNNAQDTEKFSVNASEYRQVVEGQSRMIVTTRPGWLDIEWIQGKRLDFTGLGK